MGDKAVTSFLGCCVQLLQILMEVTGLLVKNQSPLSFINYYVSKEIPQQRMENDQWLASIQDKAWTVNEASSSNSIYALFFVLFKFDME